MQITIRYVSGNQDKHEMDLETLKKFQLWLIDDNIVMHLFIRQIIINAIYLNLKSNVLII
jgi:hypothetical protein